jgi:hypothetical protein
MPDIMDEALAFPFKGYKSCEDVGTVSGSTNGTGFTIQWGSKGSWTQLIASTAKDSYGLLIYVENANISSDTGGFRLLIDIGTGASGSETVLIANLLFGDCTYAFHEKYICFVRIPAGTRIAVRSRGNAGLNKTGYIQVMLFENPLSSNEFPTGRVLPFVVGSRIETLGADEANIRGTTVKAGSSANTKGSYVAFSTSTSRRALWLIFAVVNASGGKWMFDIATGASGSEVVIIPNIWAYISGVTQGVEVQVYQFPVNIPAGSRLSVRAQSDTANAYAYPIIYLCEGRW